MKRSASDVQIFGDVFVRREIAERVEPTSEVAGSAPAPRSRHAVHLLEAVRQEWPESLLEREVALPRTGPHREGGLHHRRGRTAYPLRLQPSQGTRAIGLEIANPHLTICVERVGKHVSLTCFVAGTAICSATREWTRYALIQMRTDASLMAARKLSGLRS